MAELFVIEPIHPLTKAREAQQTLKQINKQHLFQIISELTTKPVFSRLGEKKNWIAETDKGGPLYHAYFSKDFRNTITNEVRAKAEIGQLSQRKKLTFKLRKSHIILNLYATILISYHEEKENPLCYKITSDRSPN